jgi:hypothetical protein
MVLWFEGRGPEDDSDAIELSFVEALMPDDIAILDATEQGRPGRAQPGTDLCNVVRRLPA